MGNKYRIRIYNTYVKARQKPLAPDSIGELKRRLSYLRCLVKRHFPQDREACILDLGCGHGALIYAARKEGYRNIKGVDGSPEQVDAAHALGIESVEQSDVMEALANETDASLECVISFDLIEHFERNELISLVDATHRVLKSGGRWIIHTPNAESPFGMRIRYGDLTHEMAFTQTSLSQLLFSSGFSRVDFYEDQPMPYGVKSTCRWILWQVIRSLLRFYLAVETGDMGRDAIFSQNLLAVAFK